MKPASGTMIRVITVLSLLVCGYSLPAGRNGTEFTIYEVDRCLTTATTLTSGVHFMRSFSEQDSGQDGQSNRCHIVCGVSPHEYWRLEAFMKPFYLNPIPQIPLPEQIIANGYQAERHHVITEDGYILEMHRIPFGRGQTSSTVRRPAAFIMHGLLSASNGYIGLGPEYSISYNLADAGFDVWLGNARGNKLSRRHTSLDPDDDVEKYEFFDFSWEEIGMIDIAAMIDYVLEFTGEEKLHYIGHSQGGTVFLVLASMRPEYNEKFQSVHLLAGVGYMQNFPDTQLRLLALSTDVIYSTALASGFVEVYPPGSDGSLPWETNYQSTSRAEGCTGNVETKNLCDSIGMRQLLGETEEEEDPGSTLDPISTENIGGAALKQIAHYGQNIRDRAFRRWNYGLFQNLNIYGSTAPPSYNLSLITAPVTMHYTVNDNLLDEQDVLAMAADIPNAIVRKVARDTFLHEDFAAAIDAKELVTDYMIEAMMALEDIEIDVGEDPSTPADVVTPPEVNQTDAASTEALSLLAYIFACSLYLIA